MTFNQCRLKGTGLFFFSLLILLAGCGIKESSSTSNPPDNPPPEPTETWYVCDGTPAQCLKLADCWTLVGKVIDDFALHSAILLSGEKIRLYGEYYGSMVSYISDDGVQFFLEPGIRLNYGRGPVVIKLGRRDFRMYFDLNICNEEDDLIMQVIRSAISSNGLDFVEEPGDRLVGTGTGNEACGFGSPRVVRLKDGSYRMYYMGLPCIENRELLLSAVSKDGLIWKREDGVRIDGGQFCSDWTKLWSGCPLIDETGTVRIYCGLLKCDSEGKNDHFGIFEFTSSDGLSFTWNSTPIVEGYYIQSMFHDNASDPHLFPDWGHGVITSAGLRLYFGLHEHPWTDTPVAEQGIYCLLNPNIK